MKETEHKHGAGEGRDPVIDPVCGMTIGPARAAGTATHQGKPYYFCSKHCQTRFAADPAKYLAPPHAHAPDKLAVMASRSGGQASRALKGIRIKAAVATGSSCCSTPAVAQVQQQAIDPVCGMTVDPTKAAGTHTHQGRPFYFCSAHCLTKFKADPSTYVKNSDQEEGKGACCAGHSDSHAQAVDPICGMTVDPAKATADTTESWQGKASTSA